MTAATVYHVRQNGSDAIDDPDDIYVHQFGNFLFAQIGNESVHADARVCHQQIDWAKTLSQFTHCRAHCCGISYISGQSQRSAAATLDAFGDLLENFSTPRQQSNGSAFSRQLNSQPAPNTRGRTCDQNNLISP